MSGGFCRGGGILSGGFCRGGILSGGGGFCRFCRGDFVGGGDFVGPRTRDVTL